MGTSAEPAPLDVAVVGFDRRNLAAIELFFDGPCRGRFRAVDVTAATVAVIVDADTPVGRAFLGDRAGRPAEPPSIVVSLDDLDAGGGAGAIVLRKPLRLDDLRRALDQVAVESDSLAAESESLAAPPGSEPTSGRPDAEVAGTSGAPAPPPRWDSPPPTTRPAPPPKWDAVPAPATNRPVPRWDATPTSPGPSGAAPNPPATSGAPPTGATTSTPAASGSTGPTPATDLSGLPARAAPAPRSAADLPRATGSPRRFTAAPSEWSGAKDLRRFERRQEVAGRADTDRPGRLVARGAAEREATPVRRIRDDSLRRDAARADRSTHHVAVLLDEQSLQAYVGAAPDIDPTDPAQVARASYRPDEQLQGMLEAAYRRAVVDEAVVRLSGDWGELLVDPKSRTAVASMPFEDLRPLCHAVLDPSRFTLETRPGPPPEVPEDLTRVHGWHNLAWDVALWCSRGRVPVGTDLHAPITLDHWPDLTRLTITPHAVRIVATWMEHPRSLLATAADLGIEQRSVFAVYSASRAIGLARPVGHDHLPPPPPAAIRPDDAESRFLGRLLKRLRKG